MGPVLSAGEAYPIVKDVFAGSQVLPPVLSEIVQEVYGYPYYYSGYVTTPDKMSRDGGHCFVLATSETDTWSPLTVRAGKAYHEQIWIYKVPCPTADKPASGTVTIVPAQWRVNVTDRWVEENKWIPVNTYEATVLPEYMAQLPFSLTQVERLQIQFLVRVNQEFVSQIRSIEAYDWTTDEWVKLPEALITTGELTLEGEDAARFVAADTPRVNFRVSMRTSSSGLSDYIAFQLILRGKP